MRRSRNNPILRIAKQNLTGIGAVIAHFRVMTDNEFRLHIAQNALLRGSPQRAAEYLERLLQETIDPRLRHRVRKVLNYIAQGNYDAAGQTLDRILAYEEELRRCR